MPSDIYDGYANPQFKINNLLDHSEIAKIIQMRAEK